MLARTLLWAKPLFYLLNDSYFSQRYIESPILEQGLDSFCYVVITKRLIKLSKQFAVS